MGSRLFWWVVRRQLPSFMWINLPSAFTVLVQPLSGSCRTVFSDDCYVCYF